MEIYIYILFPYRWASEGFQFSIIINKAALDIFVPVAFSFSLITSVREVPRSASRAFFVPRLMWLAKLPSKENEGGLM